MLPISIVVLSCNRRKELEANLPQLAELLPQIELIVVDNASTDGSREFLQKLNEQYPALILVLNDENQGVAGGRNSGFFHASRPFTIALDDDTLLPIETLHRVPKMFELFPDDGILAFKIIHPLTGELQNDHGDQPWQVANHHGAGFAFRSRLFRETGGIDEQCNFGAEELDFAIKTRVTGQGVLYLPELVAYHNSLSRKNDIAQFRYVRRVYNNVRIYFKYFPLLMATRNSFRYLFVMSTSWAAVYGLFGMLNLIMAAVKGMFSGFRSRRNIPTNVVQFYNNSLLQPEFGNVSITRKLWQKLSGLSK